MRKKKHKLEIKNFFYFISHFSYNKKGPRSEVEGAGIIAG